jgi:predicted MPP superfamily phosphohydrolase
MARSGKKPSAKLRKARIRHFLLTTGPNRLTCGLLYRRHNAERIEIVEQEIVAPGWPKSFDGIRIAHISDIHVGDLMLADRAIAIIEQLAATAPDMVCNTGDLVDLHWPGVEPVAEALGAIKAPLGNFFVLGNHDELDSGEDVERIVSDAGTTVLHDDVALVTRNDDQLRIGGIGWARNLLRCQTRIDKAIGDESVDLLLSHNPKAFDHAAERGIPLTLSGHTHGGQIARRNKPDANLAVAHKRSAGLYEHGDSRMYVSVGAGSLFPVRINVPAEIAILTVRSGD